MGKKLKRRVRAEVNKTGAWIPSNDLGTQGQPKEPIGTAQGQLLAQHTNRLKLWNLYLFLTNRNGPLSKGPLSRL